MGHWTKNGMCVKSELMWLRGCKFTLSTHLCFGRVLNGLCKVTVMRTVTQCINEKQLAFLTVLE